MNNEKILKIPFFILINKSKLTTRKIKRYLYYLSENNIICYRVDYEDVYIKIINFKYLITNYKITKYKKSEKKRTVEEEEEEEEVEEEAEEKRKKKNKERNNNKIIALRILQYLNIKTGKNYKETRLIEILINKGYEEKDFKK